MWQSNSVTQLVNTFVGKRANLQTVITKKHAKFPEKENFLLPDTHKYLCVLRGGGGGGGGGAGDVYFLEN